MAAVLVCKLHEDGTSKDVLVRKLPARRVEGGRNEGRRKGLCRLLDLPPCPSSPEALTVVRWEWGRGSLTE